MFHSFPVFVTDTDRKATLHPLDECLHFEQPLAISFVHFHLCSSFVLRRRRRKCVLLPLLSSLTGSTNPVQLVAPIKRDSRHLSAVYACPRTLPMQWPAQLAP